MAVRVFATEKAGQSKDFDVYGGSAAYVCPVCGKIVVVGKDKRECPLCHKSIGALSPDGKQLSVEWRG